MSGPPYNNAHIPYHTFAYIYRFEWSTCSETVSRTALLRKLISYKYSLVSAHAPYFTRLCVCVCIVCCYVYACVNIRTEPRTQSNQHPDIKTRPMRMRVRKTKYTPNQARLAMHFRHNASQSVNSIINLCGGAPPSSPHRTVTTAGVRVRRRLKGNPWRVDCEHGAYRRDNDNGDDGRGQRSG